MTDRMALVDRANAMACELNRFLESLREHGVHGTVEVYTDPEFIRRAAISFRFDEPMKSEK